jgi:ABC-2 type transport system ATP-binding protein
VIEVKNLSKRYGTHVAVEDLSFTIESGKIYGFLGPNGAGKSTTMNIMTGCLSATSGQVLIGGHDIFEEAEEAKKLIGYLPEQPPLYLDMTPREYLDFVGRMKGLRGGKLSEQIAAVMKQTRIADVENRLIRHLSKGYRQRVGVAQALLGSPEVVILDEPTVGLDPKQIIEIRDIIKELGRKRTVILSSHILSEVQAVCDVIIIISKGKLVAVDTPENLERVFAGDTTLELIVRAAPDAAKSALQGLQNVRKISCTAAPDGKTKICLSLQGNADISEAVFLACSDKRMPIVSMTTVTASLEDVFIELTDGEKGGKKSDSRI